MPELAEVEYFRRRWDPGLQIRVLRVALHGGQRLFRESDPAEIERALRGAVLLGSETRGKQMAFRFSKGAWLGVHLGMTGELRTGAADFAPGRHDHLVLFQSRRALVFTDPRMFGRIRFHRGRSEPEWWSEMPPAIRSREFSVARLRAAIGHRRAPLKALLLDQDVFPGVGNWMADEILWQTKLHPRTPATSLRPAQWRELWRITRAICRVAMKTIAVDWSDPPERWLIHRRWKDGGHCPRDHTSLRRETIGGRTTAWCPRCQRLART